MIQTNVQLQYETKNKIEICEKNLQKNVLKEYESKI